MMCSLLLGGMFGFLSDFLILIHECLLNLFGTHSSIVVLGIFIEEAHSKGVKVLKYFLKLLRCLWSSHNIPISLKSCCYSPTLIFLLLLPHPFSGVVNCYVGYLKIYMNIFHDTTNYSWINSKLFAWHHFYFENLSEKLGLIEFIHVEIWFRKDYLVSIQIEMLQPFKIIN